MTFDKLRYRASCELVDQIRTNVPSFRSVPNGNSNHALQKLCINYLITKLCIIQSRNYNWLYHTPSVMPSFVIGSCCCIYILFMLSQVHEALWTRALSSSPTSFRSESSSLWAKSTRFHIKWNLTKKYWWRTVIYWYTTMNGKRSIQIEKDSIQYTLHEMKSSYWTRWAINSGDAATRDHSIASREPSWIALAADCTATTCSIATNKKLKRKK